MAWYRKDNRTTSYTVPADAAAVVSTDLQASGLEPIQMSVTGADVVMSYSQGATGITIPDGTVMTWERQNPYGDQVWFQTPVASGTDATVVFMIAGGIQNGKRI